MRTLFPLELPLKPDQKGVLAITFLRYTLNMVDVVSPGKIDYRHETFKLQMNDKSRPYLRDYQHAVGLLNIPESLISTQELAHPYIIWTTIESFTSNYRSFETRLLKTFLDETGGKEVSNLAGARLVFIHVGHLKYIRRFPHLGDQLAKRYKNKAGHVHQFYIYGSDPSVHPSKYQVQEIWPCGKLFICNNDGNLYLT